MKVLNNKICRIVTFLAIMIFVSIVTTDTVKAEANWSAVPITTAQEYESLLQAQQQALSQQQWLALQTQDMALVQQQQIALQAQTNSLIGQQQLMAYQAQQAALAQYQSSYQQQCFALQAAYNNALYLDQMAKYQATQLSNLQRQQKINFENTLIVDSLNARNQIMQNYLDNQYRTWVAYNGYAEEKK